MKIRSKSPALKDLIENLYKKGVEDKAPVWKAVARGLNRPNRKGYEVNLFTIEKSAKPRETIVVPGSVLGSGEIKKAINIAALRFSGNSRKKIEKAGGKCMAIEELLEKNPKGSRVRIMG